MNATSVEERGRYLLRDGERIDIVAVPDRFTVRMKRGVARERLATGSQSTYRQHLQRQNLDEFSVDAELRDEVMARVRSSNEIEFASHVYALASEPKTRLYLTDEITVQFKPDASDQDVETLIDQHGLQIVKTLPGLAHAYVLRVGPQATENPIKIANQLALHGKVLVSEANIGIAAKSQYIPTDTLFPQQWHLFNSGGPQLSSAAHIHAPEAWDITRGVRSVVVAVADDSCDLSHADFQAPGKIVAPRDFAGKDFLPLPELVDDNHGTACCGVAVAEETGTGVIGVAPGCALMPIRTSGFIDDNAIEDLCDWVIDHGASVLSCSWSAAARRFNLSLRMRNALHNAATVGRSGKGCVLVFAAGNENRPVNGVVNESGWPGDSPKGPTVWLNGFAAHPDVIAVAASSSLATKSAYSNWGQEIAVCAPSNNARPGTYPRVNNPVSGRGILTTDRLGPSGYSSTDYTGDFGGTSSACPTVAGTAALMLSANPELTAAQVREILQSTADKIVDGNPDPQLGNSFGSYGADGHSPWFGHGRINAFKAVTEAKRRVVLEVGQPLRQTVMPEIAIPDNVGSGVRSTIKFTENVVLSTVKVTVDISHTYIGDLRLTLIAPTGDPVVLHDRNGGNTDNLRRSFDLSTTPGLAALIGVSIQGEWTLWVQDLAPIDHGMLNRWEVEITPRASAITEVQDAPGTSIPDNDPTGMERTLTVTATGDIRELVVALDITHTYIGDLTVTLVSPAGTLVSLHNRSGGSQDNLLRTFRFSDTPALQSLRGQSMQGNWQLRVADREAIDVGKLNRWSLTITH